MTKFFTPNPFGPDRPRIPELGKRVRWRDELHEINKLWWKRPQQVKILMYMDGAAFDGGSFGGLQHVINAVTSDPWPWAKFVVTTANRYNDPTADQDSVTLTDVALETYDEVWLFGISSNAGLLSAAEVAELELFMDNGGGVMTTGDHASLGRGLSGSAKRIKDLRMYPAPPSSAPTWNTTIRDANGDGNFSFGEQSDATPQVILPKYRYHWSLRGGPAQLKKSPHPVLCSEGGVLKKLPDHQHEGQVVIPTSLPVSDWPKAGSYQAKPEEVARGRIIDPEATNSNATFPVIGAYNGHTVNVGRIVADSTWHHWFDINLDGFDTTSDDYADIISYYQNVAAWLAPKSKQAGMRNGVYWLALHENLIFEHQLKVLPLAQLIPIVRDALGRWAPQCLVSAWALELQPLAVQAAVSAEIGQPKVPFALEDAIIGEAMIELQEHFDIQSGRLRGADDLDVIEKTLVAAAPRAAARFERDCKERLEEASWVVAGLKLPAKKKAPPKKPAVSKAKKRSVRKAPAGGSAK